MTVRNNYKRGAKTLKDYLEYGYKKRTPDEIDNVVRQIIREADANQVAIRIRSMLDMPPEFPLQVTITDNPDATTIATSMNNPVSRDGKMVVVVLCHPDGLGSITVS